MITHYCYHFSSFDFQKSRRTTQVARTVHPEITIHVGDDLEADVKGAHQAGIRSIWLDRNSKGDSKLSNRIQSLEEIRSKV